MQRLAVLLALATLAAAPAAAQSPAPFEPLTFSGAGGVLRANWGSTYGFEVRSPAVLPADVGVTVRLRDVTSARAGGFRVLLAHTTSAGQRTSALLFDGFTRADARALAGTYTFGAHFPVALPGGTVAPGEYRAEALASTFDGHAVAGRWELYVEDGRGSSGTFAGWDLTFSAAATTAPEPGTWALLGTGLLALGAVARRRAR